nr:hypothetical protein [Tanacetum cinerariifolium]
MLMSSACSLSGSSLDVHVLRQGACLSWGRWEDHGKSSGKWWSGVKIGESGAGKRCWVFMGESGGVVRNEEEVVEWGRNRGEGCYRD